MTNELSPEQREHLARLIESELRALRAAALAAGAAPESVTAALRARLGALQADTAERPAAEDDGADPGRDDQGPPTSGAGCSGEQLEPGP
ncbi:hypothetical protein [Dactylosporangium matsuzakiense]|uniref:Uncharacterized protein n=1 Tax=Dactylosporangium matsuzakiense TaxID=53360 RepID=A0A9W6KG52_9ACTN|nr:hypothetical protein [Dactylosporangium matsuzakiense]UWZ42496.1 hypothetical protein Dmats_33710 [Dactylosporangium matsuzakiense]GLL00588.1 hypothetical protein GCM10017581_023290 [Dactylosporangium matsuzakiense]